MLSHSVVSMDCAGLHFFSSPALTAKRLLTTLIAKLANEVFWVVAFLVNAFSSTLLVITRFV